MLALGLGRGVRGFEEPLRDAIISAARELVSLGGVGGLPVEGVRAVVCEKGALSRGLLNMLEHISFQGVCCSTCKLLGQGLGSLKQTKDSVQEYMLKDIHYRTLDIIIIEASSLH